MNGLMRRYYGWKMHGIDSKINSLRIYIEDCSALSSLPQEEENCGVFDEIRYLEQRRDNIRNKLQLIS